MNREEELITRWIDGELDADARKEFDALVAEDPGFGALAKQSAEALGGGLRDELSAEVEPPYPDFFNSQIQKRIHEQEKPAAAAPAERVSVWSWLKSPFTIGAAAAACLLFAATSSNRAPDGSPEGLVSTYAPDPLVNVLRAEYDESADATVIMLTGLTRIPDEVEVGGKNIATYKPTGPHGFGRFYTEDEELAYVMEMSADGTPRIMSRNNG